MSIGIVDGSRVFEVASLLSRRSYEDGYPIAWQCSIDVTSALVTGRGLSLIGTPGFERTPGLNGQVLRDVANFVPMVRIDDALRARAMSKLENEIGTLRYQARLRSALARLHDENGAGPLHPARNVDAWVEHIVKDFWIQQNRYLGGVFPEWQVRAISDILEMSTADVEDLRILGTNENELRRLSQNFALLRDEFSGLISAFLVANFLRGSLHDWTCRMGRLHYWPHPMRLGGLEGSQLKGELNFSASNTQDFFSKIVIGAAFAEKDPRARIDTWSRNVAKARILHAQEDLDLYERNSPERARSVAMAAARKVGIKTHAAWIDRVLDGTVSLGIVAISSYTLLDWQSLIEGVVSYALSSKFNVGESIAGKVLDTDRKFSELMSAEPGRLQ